MSYSSSSSRSRSVSKSSLELVDRRPPVDPGLVVGDPDDQRLLDVVLVLDLADDLLEEVLDRDQAGGAAVLVEHDRDVDLAPLQLVQEVVDVIDSGTKTGVRRIERSDGRSPTEPFRNGSRSFAYRIPTISSIESS